MNNAIAGNELQALETELASQRVRFSPLGLELPDDLDLDGWTAVGRKLCRADQVMKWWLGDWAAFGERKYGKLKEFAVANGINPQTLMNHAWVSRAVEISRRRESLEWTKHEVVAPLTAVEQTKWLDQAEAERPPVAELRKQIRISQGESNALQGDGPVVKFGLKAADDLVHWLKSRPGDFWSPDRCAAVRARLKPVVDFYELLGLTGRPGGDSQ
jgi:hypothetical protein